MSQPERKLVANLGDVNPIDYGAMFVFTDSTGAYPPEMEILEVDSIDDDDETGQWTVYRMALEPCTFTGGILSDNRYHPDHSAWFADRIDNVADSCGIEPAELVAGLCSADPVKLATAYGALVGYFGPHEFDSYPLQFTDRAELESRYSDCV